jgi:GPI mannosyltransferase 1 subunit X
LHRCLTVTFYYSRRFQAQVNELADYLNTFSVFVHFFLLVYVDNDQLSNLNKLDKLKTFVESYIDVEQPTAKAAPFKVFIFNQVKKSLNITLPIHFRYHEPSDKKFNRVEIDSPKVFLSNCHQKGRVVSMLPCANNSEITDFVDINLVSYCPWIETEIAPITLSFLIPVGNIQSYTFVLPVTIFISWIACLFLTYVIIKKSREINKKLL